MVSCIADGGNIAAGLGVIENDFHKRPDLAPNICAVFVEPEHRRRGVAKMMLDFVCSDMKSLGIKTVYLILPTIRIFTKNAALNISARFRKTMVNFQECIAVFFKAIKIA